MNTSEGNPASDAARSRVHQIYTYLSDNENAARLPNAIRLLGALALFVCVARSFDFQSENFSIFLCDYNFGFTGRGLLGTVMNYDPFGADARPLFLIFYWVASSAQYCSVPSRGCIML